MPIPSFTTLDLDDAEIVTAPDTSIIRPLARVTGASMAHGTLLPGCVSKAVMHPVIEEIWYVLGGRAELWRRHGELESTVDVGAGVSLVIPTGTHFQFRTVGEEPFTFIMCTLPPWSGEHDAVSVDGHWPLSSAGAQM
jgi:mannose-6-phosphate isomerase-like protein (cupin superfamily)